MLNFVSIVGQQMYEINKTEFCPVLHVRVINSITRHQVLPFFDINRLDLKLKIRYLDNCTFRIRISWRCQERLGLVRSHGPMNLLCIYSQPSGIQGQRLDSTRIRQRTNSVEHDVGTWHLLHRLGSMEWDVSSWMKKSSLYYMTSMHDIVALFRPISHL